jgi:hypothetical protein
LLNSAKYLHHFRWLYVAARKHKRSGLQTRKLLAQINCKQDYTSAHINCKQTHYYLQRACNHPTKLKLIANKPDADEAVGMLVCKSIEMKKI